MYKRPSTFQLGIVALFLSACVKPRTAATELPVKSDASTPTFQEQLARLAAECQERLDARVWSDECACRVPSTEAEALIAECREQARDLQFSATAGGLQEVLYLDYSAEVSCPSLQGCSVVREQRSEKSVLFLVE